MNAKNIPDIGSMRHRITFQQRMQIADGAGGSLDEWENFLTLWAAIDDPGSSDIYERGANQPIEKKTFTIRYHPTIDETMRITWNKRTFTIDGIVNIGNMNHFLEISAAGQWDA
jgi:SPP1 family predicted phage head-tail adaptor